MPKPSRVTSILRQTRRLSGGVSLNAVTSIPGLVGYWKRDPQYMFEDSAGTTPASTSGTGPVGQWRAVGVTPTLTAVTVANSGFDADSDWTKGTGWTIGSGVATKTAGSAASLSQAITLTAGSVYLITWTLTRTAGTLLPRFTGGTTVSGTALSASGTYSENLVAVTGNTTLEFYGDATFAGTVDDVSVVLLTGVVAVEATTALKPILRKTPTTGVYWADANTATSALNVALSDTVLGRRNLMTYTESFTTGLNNLTLSASGLSDPFGGTSAGLLLETAATAIHYIYLYTAAISSPHTITFVVKKHSRRYVICAFSTIDAVVVDLDAGTIATAVGSPTNLTITPKGDGWYQASVTFVGTSFVIYPSIDGVFANRSYAGDTGQGFYLCHPQVVLGSVATDYQKITNVPAYCTLARATAEGVTFTDNAEISPTYNIAPAFSFNSDVAIFNRALTATEKALITRYMARAVPMLGSNVVTNGTFDTDTTGWTAGGSSALEAVGGRLRVSSVSPYTGVVFQGFTGGILLADKAYYCTATCYGSDYGTPSFQSSSGGVVNGVATLGTASKCSLMVVVPSGATKIVKCVMTLNPDIDAYAEFDNVTAQEIL